MKFDVFIEKKELNDSMSININETPHLQRVTAFPRSYKGCQFHSL